MRTLAREMLGIKFGISLKSKALAAALGFFFFFKKN